MLKMTLVTPTRKILMDAEVEELFVPAYRGELNILEGHAGLVTTLSTGVLRYRLKGSSQVMRAAISWGYCEVSNDIVNVLAETAELPEEIDKKRAEETIQENEAKLSSPSTTPSEIIKYQNKIKRAHARLQVLDEKSHDRAGV